MAYRRTGGFTLLELLITLAVAAVITALAVPSFKAITARNRLAMSSNQLLGGMRAARMLAGTRNTAVSICAGNADEGCHADWLQGEWIVFIDRPPLGVFDADDELHLADSMDMPDGLFLAGNGPFNRAIVFRPSGLARWPSGAFAAGRLRVCVNESISPNATELVLIGSGRAVSQACDLGGVCPALSASGANCL